MSKHTPGYRCFSGACYTRHDPRLSGYGNPPSSPELQRRYPGAGRFEMRQEMIPVAELPEEIASTLREEDIMEIPDEESSFSAPQTESDDLGF